MQTKKTLTYDDLHLFTGDAERYQHPYYRKINYTPGVRHLAFAAEAYWLIDSISIWLCSQDYLQASAEDNRLCCMVFWTLEVHEDGSATLSGRADSDVPPAFEQRIPATDFPLPRVDIWAAFNDRQWTLYLPSEH
ncbi:MAG: hypothetical protein R3C53_19045 [Pirellulaceae bacterium]